MTLVDTSVWIEVFRRQDPLDIEAVVPFDEVVTCLPVVQEGCQRKSRKRQWAQGRTSRWSSHPAGSGARPGSVGRTTEAVAESGRGARG